MRGTESFRFLKCFTNNRSLRTTDFPWHTWDWGEINHAKCISYRRRIYVLTTTLFTKLDGKRGTQNVHCDALLTANKSGESATTINAPSVAESTRKNCEALDSYSSMFVPRHIKEFIAKNLVSDSSMVELSTIWTIWKETWRDVTWVRPLMIMMHTCGTWIKATLHKLLFLK